MVGPGSVVATLTLAGGRPGGDGSDLLGISFAFGLVIAAMVYAHRQGVGLPHQPGRHVRPRLDQEFPWREVPAYWGAQVVGAVLGALGIWAVFASQRDRSGMGQTSFNQDATAWASAIFAEGIGTFMLMYAILGIVDSR